MTLCFKDKTYCASPNCTNECGRKMTPNEMNELRASNLYYSYSYFCGEPDELQKSFINYVDPPEFRVMIPFPTWDEE
jgi:hypothetical protein